MKAASPPAMHAERRSWMPPPDAVRLARDLVVDVELFDEFP